MSRVVREILAQDHIRIARTQTTLSMLRNTRVRFRSSALFGRLLMNCAAAYRSAAETQRANRLILTLCITLFRSFHALIWHHSRNCDASLTQFSGSGKHIVAYMVDEHNQCTYSIQISEMFWFDRRINRISCVQNDENITSDKRPRALRTIQATHFDTHSGHQNDQPKRNHMVNILPSTRVLQDRFTSSVDDLRNTTTFTLAGGTQISDRSHK